MHQTNNPNHFQPDRLRWLLTNRGWGRTVQFRRLLAGVLVLLAAVLAVRPAIGKPPDRETALIAARDLPPGTVLQATDLAERQLPPEAIPAHALREHSQAVGRILAGAARSGEPLTDLRLAGPELTELATRRGDATAVPVRLADPAVADLLHPGSRVDLISTVERSPPTPLASDAVVLAVRPPVQGAGQQGRLVVIGLPREEAPIVAGTALTEGVAITLR
ncbi:hypothetical protein GCM10012275_59700 [Longimycelium tulufanense]|uniref:SAF domain-containing protein n=1 Tax=Longimycelium tulufanense TaxID=907463 RepID=A0A8J3CI85_9PSEU|nr:SAF domain-containing protein [Longimycelium tulufanense]GGM81093.1 hypothetical protein GCM10012275_59700 [Longimycelium tulufanense]